MINKALRLIRQFHELKQTDLATTLGISKSYLSEIESGKKPASLELLEKYSDTFEIPVSSLVFFSESIGKKNTIPQKFKTVFTDKVLNLMEWVIERDESKKIKT